MKRLISTALAVALLVSLGALAVLARGGGDILTPSDNAVAAAAQPQTAVAPDAPTVPVNKWNNIALPLDVQDQFTKMGLNFKAFDLASFIGTPGTAVIEVRRWDSTKQVYQRCSLSAGATNCTDTRSNFDLQLAGNYMVLVTSSLSQNVASFVGGVPDANSTHSLLGATPSCKWNAISLPLDKSLVTKASELVQDLGGDAVVYEVRQWDAVKQAYQRCSVNPGGVCSDARSDFATKIGYPYWVCLKTDTTWQ